MIVIDAAAFIGAVDGRRPVLDRLVNEDLHAPHLLRIEVVGGVPVKGEVAPVVTEEEDVYNALTLGVRDYLGKNGFPGALLGLSGGIDSALTLALAVDALGADKVHAVMMPSQYTAGMSCEDARAQAQTMGVRYSEIAIRPVFDAFKAALAGEFRGLPEDVTEENLQARVRGTLLMAMSNKTGSIVLTNGTDENFDPSSFSVNLQSGTTEGSQVYDSEQLGESPSTTLLPGRSATFKVAFGVTDPEDLVMEVSPTFGFDYESAIFTNT